MHFPLRFDHNYLYTPMSIKLSYEPYLVKREMATVVYIGLGIVLIFRERSPLEPCKEIVTGHRENRTGVF